LAGAAVVVGATVGVAVVAVGATVGVAVVAVGATTPVGCGLRGVAVDRDAGAVVAVGVTVAAVVGATVAAVVDATDVVVGATVVVDVYEQPTTERAHTTVVRVRRIAG